MSKVRTLTRATPIDTDVLGDHANAINALYDEVAGHTNGVQIRRDGVAQVSRRVMEAQFWAQQQALSTATKVTANVPIGWSVVFSPTFADIPVVTASLVVHSESPAMSKRGVITISSISAAGVEGSIVFPEDGTNVKVSVSIIAIGQARV